MRARQRAAASGGPRAETPRGPICQIKVTLAEIRPPVWRRVRVPADLRLDRLHAVLQAAMGWGDLHLHQFVAGGRSYGDPQFDLSSPGRKVHDERKATVGDILPAVRSRAVYEYDLGAGWSHALLLEARHAPAPGVAYPCCAAGRRACPPEDCGGVAGYKDMRAVLADPAHEDYAELMERIDGPFDAEAFDADAVNGQLRRLADRWARGGTAGASPAQRG